MKPEDVEKQHAVLVRFTQTYCREKHAGAAKIGEGVCAECRELLAYSRLRLEKCPFDPKPKCKDCRVHCYSPAQRARIREIMRFSGMYFVKRGRLDWLLRYFMS